MTEARDNRGAGEGAAAVDSPSKQLTVLWDEMRGIQNGWGHGLGSGGEKVGFGFTTRTEPSGDGGIHASLGKEADGSFRIRFSSVKRVSLKTWRWGEEYEITGDVIADRKVHEDFRLDGVDMNDRNPNPHSMGIDGSTPAGPIGFLRTLWQERRDEFNASNRSVGLPNV